MSRLSARRAASGARWACILCWLLSLLVERQHCAKTLAAGDTAKSAQRRAGTLFVVGTLTVLGLADFFARSLWELILLGVHHVW